AVDGIQRNLMTVCAVFATSPSSQQFAQIPKITEKDIEKLEQAEHALLRSTEISQQFVVPGSAAVRVAVVDVARSVTRRCERRIVRVIREKQRPDWEARLCQNYVNRLSDYLFVLARYCEQRAGTIDR
ncbi:MAG: ATP:cob(I)alamin adenosyltransferase, partial [Spirochaetia bacterium]